MWQSCVQLLYQLGLMPRTWCLGWRSLWHSHLFSSRSQPFSKRALLFAFLHAFLFLSLQFFFVFLLLHQLCHSLAYSCYTVCHKLLLYPFLPQVHPLMLWGRLLLVIVVLISDILPRDNLVHVTASTPPAIVQASPPLDPLHAVH